MNFTVSPPEFHSTFQWLSIKLRPWVIAAGVGGGAGVAVGVTVGADVSVAVGLDVGEGVIVVNSVGTLVTEGPHAESREEKMSSKLMNLPRFEDIYPPCQIL
jgi:hypothetical protein